MAFPERVAVLIVAAGRGARAGCDGPKQYQLLGDTPMLAHTIGAFSRCAAIASIAVVIHRDDRSAYDVAAASWRHRLSAPVIGGQTRQESVHAGLETFAASPPSHVLIHDAARPFADPALIGRVVAAFANHDAVLPVLPVADTLKRGKDGVVVETVPRDGLFRAQTPQGFSFDAILSAHRAAAQARRSDFTDDAAIAEWRGIAVGLVSGAEQNVKLTTTEDMAMAREAFAPGGRNLGSVRVGSGYDVHAFGPGDGVTLCGVHIAHDQSLVGHSDADVALHALTDAILGALGDGDIGTHFPPADPEWAGAASEMFLRNAVWRTHERGGSVEHLDLTIICETPKIGPHRDAFRASVAGICGISEDRVSIKATTTERLGFTGRGEGIAAMATATLKLP